MNRVIKKIHCLELLTGALLLVLLACGYSCGPDAPPTVDPARAATLVLSRDSSMYGGTIDWDVVINGIEHGEIGRSETRRYTFETHSPQNNLEVTRGLVGLSPDVVNFRASPGEVIAYAVDVDWAGTIQLKREWPETLKKKVSQPPLTPEQKDLRIATTRQKAAKKGARHRADTGGLSGFLAHWLWPAYQLIPPLGGWDWLVFIALVCLLGRLLSLPFRWQSAQEETGMWSLLASNTCTMWLCVWFFQTEAGVALLGDRVWFDALPLTEDPELLFWFSLSFCGLVAIVGFAMMEDDHTLRPELRVATAHMEAGLLFLAHVFYWYWSVTSLVVFLASLIATLSMDLFRAICMGLLRWKKGRGRA